MTTEEIYRELQYLSRMVNMLATIVQNENPVVRKEELLTWAQDINEVTERIQQAKKNVIQHFLNK